MKTGRGEANFVRKIAYSSTLGSHHIFVHPQVQELVNLQNVGGKAKPYQIR